ncbi:hypothetical protein NEOLEDRAFT_58695 [Neolentinus lepideus HHB14362 ss-1]|uniref:Uncharacterized protein n=1 Tax=Neolentinus lepideus HHB14362 ss-1 TaxID=1314782 RepID=A0A165U7X6_9AGAM|nr:hypothetical protein NEOLEDRAFT_58695 [Neolentinus lepideus HHB14362 ss-1]
MEIDTDWCLHCGFRTDGNTYCSMECEYDDQPLLVPSLCRSRSASCANSLSSSSHHGHDRHDAVFREEELCMGSTSKSSLAWVAMGAGKDESHIMAWAQNIPAGAVPQNDIIPFSPPIDSSLPSSSRSSMKSKASSPSRSGSFRRPSLLQPVAPSLCMSTPHAARPRPSLPILTPQQQIATITRPKHLRRKSAGDLSASVTSSVFISPPDTPDDLDDSGVPDYVYESAKGRTGVQDGVLKAAQTFNHAKIFLRPRDRR